MIQDEFYNNDKKIQKKIEKEKRIKNIYNEFSKILNDMKSKISSSEAWLVCPKCFQDISAIKDNYPKKTNKEIGEYLIQGSFITTSFKPIEQGKNYSNRDQFEKNMEQIGLKKGKNYDNLFCCANGETIIGYIYNKERYINMKCGLCVRYPDLKVENIDEKEYLNNFENVLKKVEEIKKWKESDDFKKTIECKLCDFTVDKKLSEFKSHLNNKFHKSNMEELKKEFLY